MTGDHQVLVGLYDKSGDAAVWRADALLVVPVGRLVQFEPQPAAGSADCASHRRRILADAGGEDDCIPASQRRPERGDMAGNAIAKHLDCEARTWIVAGQKLAEIRRD